MQSVTKSHSARRINYLARKLGIQSYLEIGVGKGRTLFNVDIANKTAVDPCFRFDLPEAQKTHRNISFHKTTSDEFFSRLPHGAKYDLIFVDGLHTFEQTYRDLCNCLIHAKERTVLLIDDVKQKDAFRQCATKKRLIRDAVKPAIIVKRGTEMFSRSSSPCMISIHR